MRFEWDEEKNLTNKRRHGVSFEEAKELFTSTADYLEIFDATHSDLEDRLIAIGPISRGLVLVVWTERSGGAVRIISARWASKAEERLYFSFKERSP